MLNSVGLPEVIIVGLILVIALGSKKINSLARRLGESSKELTKVKKEYDKTIGPAKKKADNKPASKVDKIEEKDKPDEKKKTDSAKKSENK